MIGLELAAGYLAAWGVRKLKRAGKRVDEDADELIDAGLDRLHDAVAAKLGRDPSLVKLETEVTQGLEPSERTLRRVRDAIEEAAEGDREFEVTITALLGKLEEASDGAPSAAGIDLRAARGVQVGNLNFQTNTFN